VGGHLYDYEYEDYDGNMKYALSKVLRELQSGTLKYLRSCCHFDVSPDLAPHASWAKAGLGTMAMAMAGRIVDVDCRLQRIFCFLQNRGFGSELCGGACAVLCCAVLVLVHARLGTSSLLTL
jgi:hypothetical protein